MIILPLLKKKVKSHLIFMISYDVLSLGKSQFDLAYDAESVPVPKEFPITATLGGVAHSALA